MLLIVKMFENRKKCVALGQRDYIRINSFTVFNKYFCAPKERIKMKEK
jgi:hypothetical protein